MNTALLLQNAGYLYQENAAESQVYPIFLSTEKCIALSASQPGEMPQHPTGF